VSNCVCGRTTRKPMCDKSCSLTVEQYNERTERLAVLFKKPVKDINEQSMEHINQHTAYSGSQL
jgi:predicted secreted protein